MAKIRFNPDPICCRTRPQFYRVRDRAYPDEVVWITRARGRATCPQDGSPVVTVRRNDASVHFCTSCLGEEAQRVVAATPSVVNELPKLRCRQPREVSA